MDTLLSNVIELLKALYVLIWGLLYSFIFYPSIINLAINNLKRNCITTIIIIINSIICFSSIVLFIIKKEQMYLVYIIFPIAIIVFSVIVYFYGRNKFSPQNAKDDLSDYKKFVFARINKWKSVAKGLCIFGFISLVIMLCIVNHDMFTYAAIIFASLLFSTISWIININILNKYYLRIE